MPLLRWNDGGRDGRNAERVAGKATKGDGTELLLPEPVHGVIRARLDNLNAEAVEVVRVAPVIGSEFDHALLAEVLPADVDLRPAIAALDSHATSRNHKPTPQENALVEFVKNATFKFKNVTSVDGPGEGYGLAFGCVSGGDFGAMGLHYVNIGLVDGQLEPDKPEIILFEPTRNGGIRITGVDYLIPVAAWDAAHAIPPAEHAAPPELMGQLFHLFDSPNRFGLDPFYTLHVWAWKDNPNGTFTNWNPDVSCDAFNATTPQN